MNHLITPLLPYNSSTDRALSAVSVFPTCTMPSSAFAGSQLASYPPMADFATSDSNSHLRFHHRRNGSSSQYVINSQPSQSLYGHSEQSQSDMPNTHSSLQQQAAPATASAEQTIHFSNLAVSIAAISSYIPAALHSLYLQFNLPPHTILLKNVSGSVRTGKMIAIMGASGAGEYARHVVL